MNKNSKKKSISIIISTVAAVALIVVLIITITLSNKKTTIAFYRISETQTESFKSQLNALSSKENGNFKFNYVVLNPDKPLDSQLKSKFDAIILPSGKASTVALASIPKKKNASVYLEGSLLNNTYISISSIATHSENGKISTVPLIIDTWISDINQNASSLPESFEDFTWNSLENAATSIKTTTSIGFTADTEDSANFINFMEMLKISLEGKDAAEQAKKIISSAFNSIPSDTPEAMNQELLEEILSLFKPEADLIRSWFKNGLITPDFYKLTSQSINNLMENSATAINFMPLSCHRNLSYQAQKNYSSILEISGVDLPYFPVKANENLSMVANVTLLVPLTDKGSVAKAAEHLLSKESQETVSSETGLVPSLANCRTPDSQSDDSRYWLAVGNTPIEPYSESSFSSKAQRDFFAKELLNYIK